MQSIKKILILLFCAFTFNLSVLAADFIAPNSSGEPIVIDVSELNLLSTIDVTVGDFTDQPRPYRDENTKSLVIFPPAVSSSERTIQVRAGSSTITKTISFRASPSGTLKNSLLPDLQKARGGNTVTKISDGRVVIIGGGKGLADTPTDSIEIFNPELGKSQYLKTADELGKAKLKTPRSQHTATYLGISNAPVGMISGPVEQILIVGGFSTDGALENSIEILEIKVGSDQSVSTLLMGKKHRLKKARLFHTASLLPDGRILIAGGQGHIGMGGIGALNSIEIFDPLTKTISPSNISLLTPRLLHTVTTLQNGNILVVGGFTNDQQGQFGFGHAVNTSEIIDVQNLTIRQVNSLLNGKGVGGHTATLLTNGLVLIAGGSTDFFSSRTTDEFKGQTKGTLQFYDSRNEAFGLVKSSSGGNLELQLPRFLHQATLLPNGNLIIVGGLNIKAGLSSTNVINTPVTRVEVLDLNLISFSGNSLEGDLQPGFDSSVGRIQPTVLLITPKNKTQGLLSMSDLDNFVNCAIYVTGGFTNGLGKIPTKTSELYQVKANNTIEGREIKSDPEAFIRGSFISQLLVGLDDFIQVPALQVEPQTINLSSSNNFILTTKVLSTNNQVILLKAQSTDPNGSIVVSPSLFQVGDTVSISRKDSSVQGEFEIKFIPVDNSQDFIPAKVKVNVSDSSKPFLATVPGYGISLSNQSSSNTGLIQVKVFSQDGASEFTSIPSSTQVTATISDPSVANLGGTGISSVTGTLSTQFMINALKPGNTNINFSINFPDVLPVTIPLEVSGSPTFSNTPVNFEILQNLVSNGIVLSDIKTLDSSSIAFQNLGSSVNLPLFPIYVPVNLLSSVDSSQISGLFTIRPVFGIDLSTAIPRTFVNNNESAFKTFLSSEPVSIGGIVPSSGPSLNPVAILASNDGLRRVVYESDSSSNINNGLTMISNLSDVKDVDLFEIGGTNRPKAVLVKASMLFVADAEDGGQEVAVNLSDNGFEQELITINDQIGSVVSVGNSGFDFVFPVTDAEPKVVNFKLSGNTKNISVIKSLEDSTGPYVVAYDGVGAFSIVNLLGVDAQINTFSSDGNKITKIDYAGRFSVNGLITDVLIGSTQRGVALFDLNRRVSIPLNEDLKIGNKIEDLLVIDGIAYLALGTEGILALNIGSLIDADNSTPAIITQFKKNKLSVVKPNGTEAVITKPLHASKLADSSPFLLSAGSDNNLTVIKVSP